MFPLRLAVCGSLMLVSLGVPVAAQTPAETVSLFGSEPGFLTRLLVPSQPVSREQQLFRLLLAQLVLEDAAVNALNGPDVEAAASAGALDALTQLTTHDDATVRGTAQALLASMNQALGIAQASSARRLAPAATGRFTIPAGSAEWVRIPLRADRDYVASSECAPLRALVVDADGRVIAGSVGTEGTVTFRSSRSQDALLRLRAPACSDDIVLLEEELSTDLAGSPDRQSASVGTPDRRYRSHVTTSSIRWFRIEPVEPGRRYVVDVIPEGGIDPRVVVYDAGNVELGSDDDGGRALGRSLASRLAVVASAKSSHLLLGIEASGAPGTFVTRVTTSPPVRELARSIATDVVTDGRLEPGSESWWQINTIAGRMYSFEVFPDNNLDSFLAVFAADGVTSIGEDDDGGSGLGSRLEFTGTGEPVFARVTDLNGDAGDFRVAAEVVRSPLETAKAVIIGKPSNGVLRENRYEWWRLEVQRDRRYVFETTIQSPELDTIIDLYEVDGTTLLASDDDGGSNLGSRLEWLSPTDATVFLKVSRYDRGTGEYRLTVTPPTN